MADEVKADMLKDLREIKQAFDMAHDSTEFQLTNIAYGLKLFVAFMIKSLESQR